MTIHASLPCHNVLFFLPLQAKPYFFFITHTWINSSAAMPVHLYGVQFFFIFLFEKRRRISLAPTGYLCVTRKDLRHSWLKKQTHLWQSMQACLVIMICFFVFASKAWLFFITHALINSSAAKAVHLCGVQYLFIFLFEKRGKYVVRRRGGWYVGCIYNEECVWDIKFPFGYWQDGYVVLQWRWNSKIIHISLNFMINNCKGAVEWKEE